MNDSIFWRDGLRILCVRLDNLGDVLMTTPAFRALKETWPACHLTLLTSSAGAAIASSIPELDQIIRFDVPWTQNQVEDQSTALLSLAQQLDNQHFDAAILFTVQSQSPLPMALICYLARIPHVLGYCRENPYRLISDWIPDPEVLVATRHEVERQLALVETIGCRVSDTRLSLEVSIADQQYVQRILLTAGLDPNRPWLVLHPGVSEVRRRYPAEAFAQATARLIQDFGYQLVLTGSASESTLTVLICQQIMALVDNYSSQTDVLIDLAGQLSIGQLAALIAEAPLLLANNTGPVHIAAAVGTPVVVLYAKTNPQHTPWQVPNRILYFDVPQPLRSRNVLLQYFPEQIPSTASPDAIVQAVQELTAESVPTPSLS